MSRPTTQERTACRERVLDSVEQKLKGCPFGFIFRKVSAQYHDGVLVLQGKVPSFYLKQVLQEMLRGVGEQGDVQLIRNDVDVVCSNGLSSVREATEMTS